MQVRPSSSDALGASRLERPDPASFERDLLEQVAAIRDTVDVLASAVESIELKLDEFIQLRAGSTSSAALKHARSWPGPMLGSSPYSQGDSPLLTLNTEQGRSDGTQSDKLLANALHKILLSLPSRYEDVANSHEEVKLFVALTMNLIPDTSPNGIISQALLPYLRMSTGGRSPPLSDRIWSDMQTVTGCNEDEVRRTFKRMIDIHYRGFKRKMIPLDQFPASMLRLMNWLKTNVLLQLDQETELIPHMSSD